MAKLLITGKNYGMESMSNKRDDASDAGELKYMWQLNFMHWADRHTAIVNGLDKAELSPLTI